MDGLDKDYAAAWISRTLNQMFYYRKSIWKLAVRYDLIESIVEHPRGYLVLKDYCSDPQLAVRSARLTDNVSQLFCVSIRRRVDILELLIDDPLDNDAMDAFISFYDSSRYALMVRLFTRHPPTRVHEIAVTADIIRPAFPFIIEHIDYLFMNGTPSVVIELARCWAVPEEALLVYIENEWFHVLRSLAQMRVRFGRPILAKATHRMIHWVLMTPDDRDALAEHYGTRIREPSKTELRARPLLTDPIGLWVGILAFGLASDVEWKTIDLQTKLFWIERASIAEPSVDYSMILAKN
jgi:hypothetical protein